MLSLTYTFITINLNFGAISNEYGLEEKAKCVNPNIDLVKLIISLKKSMLDSICINA